MSQVFISYYREDKQFALAVKDKIEQIEGIKGWMDEDISGGEEWRPVIDEAIQSSSALILIATPKALKREWVTYEWVFALGANKLVIPAVFRAIDGSRYHDRLKELNWRFFTDDRPPEWDRLLQDLQRVLGRQDTIYAPPGAIKIIENVADDLNTSDPDRWYKAIQVLEGIPHDEDASETLRRTAIQHLVPKVRHKAAFAHLRQTRYGAVVIAAFREAALQGESDIRQEAWSLLGTLGGEDAIEILTTALQQENDRFDRFKIIEALGNTGRNGYPGAVPILSRHLDTITDTQEREAAIQALGNIKSDHSVEALVEYYPNSWIGHRRTIISTLAKVRNESAITGLFHILDIEEVVELQVDVIDTLKVIGGPLVLGGLENRLPQFTGRVKQEATWAITEIRKT